VYDFDNTRTSLQSAWPRTSCNSVSVVFHSPLPNPKVWNGSTIGSLQELQYFGGGGWWHDARILAATGEGVEKEEARAWEGWWNEQVVWNPLLGKS
jgi:hypothetical protein